MSPFDPKIHHRKSIRLAGYDYTQAGAYFVTVVTWRRDCLFGAVVNGAMRLNDFGKIADECWRAIPEHFPQVELGAHVVMPNHVHGIILINEDEFRHAVGAAPLRQRAKTKIHTKSTSNRGLWARLCGPTNPPSPIASTNNSTPPASGSATTTNTSSAMNTTWPRSGITLNPIRPCGPMMTKTPPT
jgi:REP element-mobilizing transposase RayT